MSSDQYVFDRSVNTSNENRESFIYRSEQFVTVPDQNMGSYSSSQVRFDLSQIANSGKYFCAQRSQLLVPLCLTLTGDVADNALNQYAISMKNGLTQIINSMSVQVTNDEVVSIQNYHNLLINYKLLSELTPTDLMNMGASLGFIPDNPSSVTYANSAEGGVGLSNTTIVSYPATGFNYSRWERMQTTNFTYGVPGLYSSGQNLAENVYKSNITRGAGFVNLHIYAVIPLGILHDFFKNLPLTKNTYITLTLNLNINVTSTITYAVAAGPPQQATVTAVQTTSPFGMCPFQVSTLTVDGAVNNGAAYTFPGAGCAVDDGGDTLVASLTVARPSVAAIAAGCTPCNLAQCQLICSLVDLNSVYEAAYLEEPLKVITYRDILSYNTIMNIPPGGIVNQLLTPGLSRLRRLIIYPFVSAVGQTNPGNNQQTNGNRGTTPQNSPFASEPATTSPFVWMQNFNVSLSGVNVYQQNQMYSYQNFLQEVRANTLNGGLEPGLSGGLVNQRMFDSNYSIITVDLSRHPLEDDSIAKSVTVSFTNASNWSLDYYCIIEYERSCPLNIEQGAIVLG